MLQGPKAVLGPGTGLGEAQLFWDSASGGYRVWPSEGAHAQFAPRGWRQRALQAHIEAQLGYCEVEHVSSRASLLAASGPSGRQQSQDAPSRCHADPAQAWTYLCDRPQPAASVHCCAMRWNGRAGASCSYEVVICAWNTSRVHDALQVACGSGLERIYKFLQTDKAYNRCGVNLINEKVSTLCSAPHERHCCNWLSCHHATGQRNF